MAYSPILILLCSAENNLVPLVMCSLSAGRYTFRRKVSAELACILYLFLKKKNEMSDLKLK